MKIIKNKKRAFLLIETVVYLFLFTLMMGGSISLFYHLLESNQNLSDLSRRSQEAEYILGKISWLTSDFKDIYSPLPGETSNVLSLMKHSGNKYILLEQNGEVFLQINDEEALPLNNNGVEVLDLIFESVTQEDVDVPFVIRASFSIDDDQFSLSRFNYAQ